MNQTLDTFKYDDATVRKFMVATFVWGLVGMLVVALGKKHGLSVEAEHTLATLLLETPRLVEETLATRQSRGPVQVSLPAADADGREQEAQASLLMTHVIPGTSGEIVAVLLVERDVAYLSRVHSMLAYSRKLVALGRAQAG